MIFCSWKGRCTQTCFKKWQIEYGRRCEWITEFRNRNGLMAGTSDWSGQISPALIQCLRWCKTEWAACTPCLKTEKLKCWKTEKFANPLETGVDPTHTHTPQGGKTCNDNCERMFFVEWHQLQSYETAPKLPHNHVSDILGFFGFAQWPSDGIHA